LAVGCHSGATRTWRRHRRDRKGVAVGVRVVGQQRGHQHVRALGLEALNRVGPRDRRLVERGNGRIVDRNGLRVVGVDGGKVVPTDCPLRGNLTLARGQRAVDVDLVAESDALAVGEIAEVYVDLGLGDAGARRDEQYREEHRPATWKSFHSHLGKPPALPEDSSSWTSAGMVRYPGL